MIVSLEPSCLFSAFVDLYCLWFIIHVFIDLRNEFNFRNVPGIMNTSGLLQSK